MQTHDGRQAAVNSDEYAWRLFVALNWPADTTRRAANRAEVFGAPAPAVWETWQNIADVYLPGGRDPGPWGAERASAAGAAEGRRFETASLKDFANVRHIVNGRMVPLEDPVASAKRLTEIRMDKPAFEYIRARQLYNLEGQLRAVAADGVHFPAGATEIKAKWRPISAAEQARYHTVTVRLADGTSRLYGLTALHIVVKDLPQWFWATFEHTDNASLPDGDGWQLPSRDAFACRGVALDCNRAPRGIGLDGTVWRFYRLRGTLTRFVDTAQRPQLLANSELEAGLQNSSSCVTCHSRAALGVVADTAVRLPIFDAGAAERRGFVGLPRAAWFNPGGGAGRPLFQQLDFVWSLAKAQSRSGT
jgi:hypothetical protein